MLIVYDEYGKYDHCSHSGIQDGIHKSGSGDHQGDVHWVVAAMRGRRKINE